MKRFYFWRHYQLADERGGYQEAKLKNTIKQSEVSHYMFILSKTLIKNLAVDHWQSQLSTICISWINFFIVKSKVKWSQLKHYRWLELLRWSNILRQVDTLQFHKSVGDSSKWQVRPALVQRLSNCGRWFFIRSMHQSKTELNYLDSARNFGGLDL